jgi:hypothetical protein
VRRRGRSGRLGTLFAVPFLLVGATPARAQRAEEPPILAGHFPSLRFVMALSTAGGCDDACTATNAFALSLGITAGSRAFFPSTAGSWVLGPDVGLERMWWYGELTEGGAKVLDAATFGSVGASFGYVLQSRGAMGLALIPRALWGVHDGQGRVWGARLGVRVLQGFGLFDVEPGYQYLSSEVLGAHRFLLSLGIDPWLIGAVLLDRRRGLPGGSKARAAAPLSSTESRGSSAVAAP